MVYATIKTLISQSIGLLKLTLFDSILFILLVKYYMIKWYHRGSVHRSLITGIKSYLNCSIHHSPYSKYDETNINGLAAVTKTDLKYIGNR